MVLFGVPPQNRKSNRPVDSNFVHNFQQQITKELTARDEGEDPFPKDPLLLPGMTSSKSSTMRVTPILKQEDGDMVRGDCANHKWTEAELTSRVEAASRAGLRNLLTRSVLTLLRARSRLHRH